MGSDEKAGTAGAVDAVDRAAIRGWLSVANVIRYLEERSLLSAGAVACAREPSGGNSNTVLRVDWAGSASVERDALTPARPERRIAGAGLDVFVLERLGPDRDLLARLGLLATPHTSFYSQESVAESATLAARNAARVLAGGRVADPVNRQVYEEREMAT